MSVLGVITLKPGVKTIDLNDERGRLSGAIAFQLCHGEKKMTEVSFKDVYVRPLIIP